METEGEGSHGNLLLSRFGLEATHVAWTDLLNEVAPQLNMDIVFRPLGASNSQHTD
jgi:hypothetical protein